MQKEAKLGTELSDESLAFAQGGLVIINNPSSPSSYDWLRGYVERLSITISGKDLRKAANSVGNAAKDAWKAVKGLF